MKKPFLKFVVPSVISMWVFSIYTIVDGFFVANFAGMKELSAVTLVVPYVSTLFALAILFSVGSQTLIGVLLGRKEKDLALEVFSFSLLLVLGISFVLSLLSWFFIDPLLRFLGAKGDLYPLAKDYFQVIILFAPFFILAYYFEVIVKVDGHPKIAILGSLSAFFTNIILDYLFIAIFHMGVFGAALATGIAQFLSVMIFLMHFRRGVGHLTYIRIKRSFSELFRRSRRIFRLGLGEFIAEFNGASQVFIFNFFILRFLSEDFLPTFAVMNYLSIFVHSTFQGITLGSLPLLSFFHGAEERKKSFQIIRYGFLSIAIVAILAFTLSNVFAGQLLDFYLEEGTFLESSLTHFRVFVCMFLCSGFNVFIASIASSIGKPRISMIIHLSRGLVLLTLSLLFVISFFGAKRLFYAAILSELLTLLFSLYFYRRMKRE